MTAEDQDYSKVFEEVLTGQKKNYTIFNGLTKTQKKKTAIGLIKNIMTYQLEWTTEELRFALTPEILEGMKMTPLIRYLDFPFAFHVKTDLPLIAMMVETEDGVLSEVQLTERVYDYVKSGYMRYPKQFFDSTEGWYRLLLCLKLALNEKKIFKNPDEMFKFMYLKGKKFLKENYLETPFKLHYSGDDESPVLLLFDSFPEDKQKEYKKYFDYYRALEKERAALKQNSCSPQQV